MKEHLSCLMLAIMSSMAPVADLPTAAAADLTLLWAPNRAGTAMGVSANGDYVTGNIYQPAESGFVWSEANGLEVIETVGFPFNFSAYAVTNDGAKVAGSATWAAGDVGSEATLWTRGTGFSRVHPDAPSYSYAMDITPDGAAIVGGNVGFIARSGHEVEDLLYGPLMAVTPTGHAAAGYAGSAFRWAADSGFTFLSEAFPGSRAYDLSDDGSIVVGSADLSQILPLVWTEHDGAQLLPLPDGFRFGWANAISGDGRLIVGQGDGTAGSRALLWDENRDVHVLDDLLDPVSLHGWNLRSAEDISADGRVIVGGATPTDSSLMPVGFRLVIPEPATVTIAVLTLAVASPLLRRL